ncbi:MAG: hypothetical protein AB9903_16110 [Vulcanimicrobiota bacterium]
MPTLEITASMQKLAHIAFIVKTFNEGREQCKMIDKSSMQKLCYLMQEMFGIPLKYEFRLYSYGPYCADLTGDIEYTEYLKGIQEYSVSDATSSSDNFLDFGERYDDLMKDAGNLNGDGVKEKLEQGLSLLKEFTTIELDLVATIHLLFSLLKDGEKNKESLIARMKEMKPKIDVEALQKMIEFLMKQGAIRI